MPFAHVNSIDLHYEIADFTRPWEGEPQTLVFLHGLHGHLQWWRWYQMAHFAQYFRVIALDQRGHGRSFKPAGPYSIETMADDLFHLLRLLDIEQVHLCGASMGGMEMCIRDRSRICPSGSSALTGTRWPARRSRFLS